MLGVYARAKVPRAKSADSQANRGHRAAKSTKGGGRFSSVKTADQRANALG